MIRKILASAPELIGTPDENNRFFATMHCDPILHTTHAVDFMGAACVVCGLLAKVICWFRPEDVL
jgi:uncharacterized membrane protein YphA (DoxX/SURF4 family)